MAMMVHLEIEGATSGKISEKCSLKKGREDTVEVYELDQELEIPAHGSDGRAGGHRVHKPLVFFKAIDRSSPLLANSLASNEKLTLTFRFYRSNPDGDGKEEQFYTIKIEDARLCSYKGRLPNVRDRAQSDLPPMERLEVIFGKITNTFERDGVIFTDDWNAPR